MKGPARAKTRLVLAERQGQKAAAELLIQGTTLVGGACLLAYFQDMGACDDF